MARKRSVAHRCECADSGCPVHPGNAGCPAKGRTTTLYRVDMEDRTGTRMCADCATDALESGLFTTQAA